MSYCRLARTTFLAILPLFAEASNVSANDAVQLSDGLISASGSVHCSLRFDLSQAQKEDLDQLLRDQQTPRSPRFHKFLTSEEFGTRFAPSDADLATVQSWLQTKGFANVEVSHSKTS